MSDRRTDFIYEQLNTLKLGGTVSEDIQRLQDQVNIQAVNIEAMKTYNLINKATFRTDSAALPGAGKIIQTSGDGNRTQFRPEPGEVWELVGADMLDETASTTTINLLLVDGSGTATDGNLCLVGQFQSTGQDFTGSVQYPIIVTHSLYLQANVSGTGDGRMTTALVQIR